MPAPVPFRPFWVCATAPKFSTTIIGNDEVSFATSGGRILRDTSRTGWIIGRSKRSSDRGALALIRFNALQPRHGPTGRPLGGNVELESQFGPILLKQQNATMEWRFERYSAKVPAFKRAVPRLRAVRRAPRGLSRGRQSSSRATGPAVWNGLPPWTVGRRSQ